MLARVEWSKELDGNAHITLTPVQGKLFMMTQQKSLFPTGGINHPVTGNVVDVWTYYENWTFRNFLSDTAISQTVGEDPVRTNKEVFNFVMPQ